LEVDPYGVILVGSACTGFSLSPNKNFREFHAGSDFDVAVISDRHFDQAWRFLRDLGSDVLKLPAQSRQAVNSHRSGHVFDGVIATDRFVQFLPFAEKWVPVLERASLDEPADGRPVKVRLYRDLFALRSYQRRGVEAARTRLTGE
jgi:predicted nucleotidyltransferase